MKKEYKAVQNKHAESSSIAIFKVTYVIEWDIIRLFRKHEHLEISIVATQFVVTLHNVVMTKYTITHAR